MLGKVLHRGKKSVTVTDFGISSPVPPTWRNGAASPTPAPWKEMYHRGTFRYQLQPVSALAAPGGGPGGRRTEKRTPLFILGKASWGPDSSVANSIESLIRPYNSDLSMLDEDLEARFQKSGGEQEEDRKTE